MYLGPWSVHFRPRTIFDWGCLSCQGTAFTGFYDVFDIFIDIQPVHITVHVIPGWPVWKSFRILLWNVVGITTSSLYSSTSSHREKMSEVYWSFSQILVLVCLLNSSFRASCLIWLRVTGSSLIVLHNVVLNSPSIWREPITIASRGSLCFWN